MEADSTRPRLTFSRSETPSLAVLVVSAGVFALLCLRTLLYQYSHLHQIAFADDAYYYFVVARHLVLDGRSTFDGLGLTNGYHPLWLAILTVQYKVFGQSLLLTRCIEFALGEITLVTTLLLLRLPKLIPNVLFGAGLFFIMQRISFNGMETAIFACCYSLFTCISLSQKRESTAAGLLDGLLASAVIASRIDSALFILPQLLWTAKSWSRRASACAVVVLFGAAYGIVNRHYFGIALPVSGEVKALGGLQLNGILFRFMERVSHPAVSLCYLIICLVIVALFLLRAPLPYARRELLIPFVMGYSIFWLRLAFMSSWVIWPWYDYPLLIGYVACVPALAVWGTDRLDRLGVYPKALAAAMVLIFVLAYHFLGIRKGGGASAASRFSASTSDIPAQVRSVLAGERVAMGDRAGNFAYRYAGSVSQLEGIMNDEEYFGLLRKKGNVRNLVCARKVKYVLAYEADLGGYNVHEVHTIRPELSQYAAPKIEVSKATEILKIPDVSPNAPGTASTYLYVWKLDCGAAPESELSLAR
jgi:hypothetical protein